MNTITLSDILFLVGPCTTITITEGTGINPTILYTGDKFYVYKFIDKSYDNYEVVQIMPKGDNLLINICK